MAKSEREPRGGIVVDVFGEDEKGNLRHQPEVAAALNKFIDQFRGRSYEELKVAFSAAHDLVEKDAIRMYAIANFRTDPFEDRNESVSVTPSVPLTKDKIQKGACFTVMNTVSMDVQFVGLGPKDGQHDFTPGQVFSVQAFNEEFVQVTVHRYPCPRVIRIEDLEKILVKND